MPEILTDDKYDEEWKVVLNNSAEYILSKMQAVVLLQEIANGNRGTIPFRTFVIPIPYIVEFYRTRKFLKGTKQLPARASDQPVEPISKERLAYFRKEIYRKLGRKK
jgi:hypothetical protein